MRYIVPAMNLDALKGAVEKLARRAAKLKLPPITLTATPDHERARVAVLTVDGHINSRVWMKPAEIEQANKKWPHRDTGERATWYAVEITGDRPTLAGDWTFCAVLEPMTTDDGETLNLIRALPGETCPAEYRTRIGACDHCKTTRRRSQTFVVRSAEGAYKVVGRQCLKDFLGYNADPQTLAAAAELLAELAALCSDSENDREESMEGAYRATEWNLEHFVAQAAAHIRLHGFLGRTKAREQDINGSAAKSTADQTIELLTPPHPSAGQEAMRDWQKFAAAHEPNAADKATAESAIEWAKTIDDRASDYLYNVNLVARHGRATRKTAGIAASIITAWQRATGQYDRPKQTTGESARPASKHIGTIGERLLLHVLCTRVILREGEYGTTGIHTLVTDDGAETVWFSSTGKVFDEGESAHVQATIKAHGEFRGTPQTTLSRVTALDSEALAKAQAKADRAAAKAAKKQQATAAAF